MANAQDKIEALVQRLSKRAETLKSEDAHALSAFIDTVEQALSANGAALTATQKTILHWLAANALTRMKGHVNEERLHRTLIHLDAVEELCPPPQLPCVHIKILMSRAAAFQRFGDFNSDETIDRALHINQELLQAQAANGSDAIAGIAAYNAGELLLRRNALTGRPNDLASARSLFETAYERYHRAGKEKETIDAGFRLTSLLLDQLRTETVELDERRRIFEKAWRLAANIIVGLDITSDLREWGLWTELAASLMSERPGHPPASNTEQTRRYLDHAFNLYRQLDDLDLVRASATRILEEMERLPANTEDYARRYEYYFMAWKNSLKSSDQQQILAATILAANVWFNVSNSVQGERTNIALTRARHLAEEAHSLASSLGNHRLCALALLIVGRSLIGPGEKAADSPAVGGTVPDAHCQHLTHASAILEDAIHHARAAHDRNLLAKALKYLLVAMGERIISCGHSGLLEQSIGVAQEATTVCAGVDRSEVSINLAGLLIHAIRDGQQQYLRATRDVLANVPVKELPPPLAAYAQSLHDTLDELEFVGPSGMTTAEKLFTSDGGLSLEVIRPEQISFTIYNILRSTLHDNAEPINVITLLLSLQHDDRASGRMQLTCWRSIVTATFYIACPHCGTPHETSFPVAISIDEDPSFAGKFEALKKGDERCAICKESLQIQFFFTALDRRFADKLVVVHPDILQNRAPRVFAQQWRIVCAIRETWLGRPAESAIHVPWSQFIATPPTTAGAAIDLPREAAIAALASAVLSHDISQIERALLSHPFWRNESRLLQVDEISAAVQSLGYRNLLHADLKAIAGQIGRLLSAAREQGVENLINSLQAAAESSANKHVELREVIGIAADTRTRRTYLKNFIAETPDYSPERLVAFYYMSGLFDSERVLKKMVNDGIGENDPKYRGARAMLYGLRDQIRATVNKDKLENSSAAAKSIVIDKLEEPNLKFILLLRAFSLEVTSTPSAGYREKVREMDPRIEWRHSWYSMRNRRAISSIVNATSNDFRLIMIANVNDLQAPPGPKKLFVSDIEWRQVVFSLMAEAGAIVLLLPTNVWDLSPGVIEEITALQLLDRVGATIIVVMASEPTDEETRTIEILTGDRVEARRFEHASTYLREAGFTTILFQAELEDNPGKLRECLNERLGRHS